MEKNKHRLGILRILEIFDRYFENSQILIYKVIHRFLLTTKIFTFVKYPHRLAFLEDMFTIFFHKSPCLYLSVLTTVKKFLHLRVDQRDPTNKYRTWTEMFVSVKRSSFLLQIISPNLIVILGKDINHGLSYTTGTNCQPDDYLRASHRDCIYIDSLYTI